MLSSFPTENDDNEIKVPGEVSEEKELTEDLRTDSVQSSQEQLSVATNGVHDLLINDE